MPDENPNDSPIDRRRFLQLTGAATTIGLAGCSTPDFFSNPGGSGTADFEVKTLEERYKSADRRILMSTSQRQAMDLEEGQQVRVAVKGGPYQNEIPAVLTLQVSQPIDVESGVVYLAEEDMERIGALPGDQLRISGEAPSEDVTNSAVAEEENEYIEELVQGDSRGRGETIILAPNGGNIQPYTSNQATRVSNTLSIASWITYGFDVDRVASRSRWYVSATDFHEAAYPELENFIERYEYAISFHGEDDAKVNGVAIGGLASIEDKELIRDEIRQALSNAGVGNVPVQVFTSGVHQGTSPNNIANRATRSGRQGIVIKQSVDVRENYWKEVADGVANAVEKLTAEEE